MPVHARGCVCVCVRARAFVCTRARAGACARKTARSAVLCACPIRVENKENILFARNELSFVTR
eukprot:6189244-Pleurochrysis_carterae.AAC.1